MTALVVASALLALSTLVLWIPIIWSIRTFAVYIILLLEIAAVAVFIYTFPGWWAIVFGSLSIYKIVSLLRIVHSKMQPTFLRKVTLRTAIVLTIMQLSVSVIAIVISTPLAFRNVLVGIALFQLAMAILLCASTLRHLKTTKTLQATKAYTDRELPTVSVLIPARNETADLEACLAAMVASDYPKLEIIVVDDCSQNKHTPEIIRSFAHAGVRFIAGEVPSDNWLAKNYAYQQLAEAANGEYLLFCGVDLCVEPGAIRELITTMLEKDKSMLSVLPQNSKPHTFSTYLIQPIRYGWELSLPRRLFSRPPVLSTCWIVKQELLHSVGSFKAASRSILPESHFAKAAARSDGYSFLRSNMLISNKSVAEQRATAIRMRYPQLHRRMEWVWTLTVVELLGAVAPLPMALLLFAVDMQFAGALSLLAAVIGYAVYLQVTAVMYGRPVLWGVLLLPIATVYDVLLLNYSMYRYEFREVNWKERNICLPVMRFDAPVASTVQPARRPN